MMGGYNVSNVVRERKGWRESKAETEKDGDKEKETIRGSQETGDYTKVPLYTDSLSLSLFVTQKCTQ
jgi:hypothetical protein